MRKGESADRTDATRSHILHLNVSVLSSSLSIGCMPVSFVISRSFSSLLSSSSSLPSFVSFSTRTPALTSLAESLLTSFCCVCVASSSVCVSEQWSAKWSVFVWSCSCAFSSEWHQSAVLMWRDARVEWKVGWLGSDELRERIWCLASWSWKAHTYNPSNHAQLKHSQCIKVCCSKTVTLSKGKVSWSYKTFHEPLMIFHVFCFWDALCGKTKRFERSRYSKHGEVLLQLHKIFSH